VRTNTARRGLTRLRLARPALGVTLAFLTAFLASGCTSGPMAPTASTAPASPARATAASAPFELIGLWRVSGAAGEGPDTWLRLGNGDLSLWRDCGMLTGAWAVGESAFVAQVDGVSRECAREGFPVIGWLDEARAHHAIDDGWQLLDGRGDPLATLTVDGAPEPIDTAAEYFAEPPAVDEGVRAAFAPAAPLPDSLAPATSSDLLGRWVPAGDPVVNDPHVVFETAGRWRGTDGCNEVRGRWVFESAGRLITTSGGSTDVGCEGVLVPSWVTGARLAGFDGPQLVLLGRTGVELGRLARAPN